MNYASSFKYLQDRFNIQNAKGSICVVFEGREGSCGVFVYQFADLEIVVPSLFVCLASSIL